MWPWMVMSTSPGLPEGIKQDTWPTLDYSTEACLVEGGLLKFSSQLKT